MSIVKNGSRNLIKNRESTSIYGSAYFKVEEKSVIKQNENNNRHFVNKSINDVVGEKVIQNDLIYKEKPRISHDINREKVNRESIVRVEKNTTINKNNEYARNNRELRSVKSRNYKEPNIIHYDINREKVNKEKIVRTEKNTTTNKSDQYVRGNEDFRGGKLSDRIDLKGIINEKKDINNIVNKSISEKIGIYIDSQYKKITNNKEPNIIHYDINGEKRKIRNIARGEKIKVIGRYTEVIETLNYTRYIRFAKLRNEFIKNNYVKASVESDNKGLGTFKKPIKKFSDGKFSKVINSSVNNTYRNTVINRTIESLNRTDENLDKTLVKQKLYRTISTPRDSRRAVRTLRRVSSRVDYGIKVVKEIPNIKRVGDITKLREVKLKKVLGNGIATSLISQSNSLRGNENIGIQSIIKTKDAITKTKNTIDLTKATLRYSGKTVKEISKIGYKISRTITKVAANIFSNPIMIKILGGIVVSVLGLTLIMSIFTGVIAGFIGDESKVEVGILNETQREFTLKLIPVAQENYKEFGIFPSVTIAQAIHESAWGKSGLSVKANNLFGIKADPSWTGKTIEMLTEEHINGSVVTVMAKWRLYDNFEDSVRDHGRFLKENSRYEQAGVFKARDYREQAYAIRLAGYATDPQYASLICNTIDAYSLYIYDFMIGEGNEVVERAITTGMSIVGKSPYVFGGGRNPEDIAALRFDCSSFIHWCYANAGINLGDYRYVTTYTLVKMGSQIKVEDMKRGDLIFFDTYTVDGHIGIYLGDGKFLHDGTSRGVEVSDLNNSYWKKAFNGKVRRIIE